MGTKLINKGTGAGGSNTNCYGKKFEEKTNIEKVLLEKEFKKSIIKYKKHKINYLSKTLEDKTIIFLSQNCFKFYLDVQMKHILLNIIMENVL